VIKIRKQFKFRGQEVVTWDIETTGLSPIDDEIITCAFFDGRKVRVCENLNEVKNYIHSYNHRETLFVGYNSGSFYNEGFDLPFMRLAYLQSKFEFPFTEYYHLDLFPLITKFFNLFSYNEEPMSKSSLYADDLKKLAEANEIEYINKNETYEILTSEEDTDWLDYKEDKKEKMYDEQSLYQLLFDSKGEEEYIDGAEVPELYEEGEIDKIKEHNKKDVMRLFKIIPEVFKVIPEDAIMKNVEVL